MDAIEGKLYSPFQKTTTKPVFKEGFSYVFETETSWERLDATVSKIRISQGYPIKTFRQLIGEVALVTLSNKRYEMFYRGQRNDYKDNQSVFHRGNPAKTIIYPTICRPDKNADGSYKYSIKQDQIRRRYDNLYKVLDELAGRRNYNPEYYFALCQHYEVLPTPLIDITQSLRVAATFALESSKSGYVYVFGLPYPNQSISHFTDIGIVLVKLQNVCPVYALRPRYQEGYLVGKYPFRPTKEGGDNLARRLVAKFHVHNSNGLFWDKDFQPMPHEVLFPVNDKAETELKKMSAKYSQQSS